MFIQGYLKYLDKLQEWVIHLKTKKELHISTCPKMRCLWSLIERLHSTMNTLNISYSTYNWHNAFKCTVPLLRAVEFSLFIKPQFTTKAQNVLHVYQCTHAHVSLWTLVSSQRTWGCCEWFDKQNKYVGSVPLHFKIEMNTVGILSVPTGKNIKHWDQYFFGLYLEI